MLLSVPIFYDNKIFNEVEIKNPKTPVITGAYSAATKGKIFRAMKLFVTGCIESISSIDGEVITDPMKINQLAGFMPYITAEAVALKVMVLVNEDDVVEGVYKCPRCQYRVIAEYDKALDEDTRDRIDELEIKCMSIDNYENRIPVKLCEPVNLKNKRTGEVLHRVESLSIEYPTLNHCIAGGENMIDGQEAEAQIKIYTKALVEINDEPVEKQWVSTWGKLLFDCVFPKDLKQISRAMLNYGINKMIERNCPDCGKVWEAPINTSNFFASGLQPS